MQTYVEQAAEKGGAIMSKETNTGYFDQLLKNSKTSKKQIALYLDDAKIERIDLITRLFSSISDSRSFARNTLIEEAIDKFLADSEEYLLEEKGIDVEKLLEEMRSERYNTVILSSTGRGFEDVFLGEAGEACWYPCRISDTREQHLTYIAIYRGQPVSAITHYAKIKECRYDEEKKAKVCYFDGDPIELPHKIGLGNKDACYFVGTKYTTLNSLLNAETCDELVFG